MKTLLRALKGLVALVVLAAVALVTVGSVRLSGTVAVPDHPAPSAATTPEEIAEGRRLADVLVCTQCHGPDLAGTDFLDGGPFMTLPAPNLTGGRVSAEAIERAVRHGVRMDGTPLLIMPSEGFADVADEDLAAIAGYIASLPDTPSELISRSVGPIGRAVASFQAPTLQPAKLIAQGSTHRSGPESPVNRYTPLCAFCHGSDYGGQMFSAEQTLWAPNLTSDPTGASSWALEEFGRAVRQGRTPDGRTLNADEMPWRGFSNISDSELEAVYGFLRSLPPVARARPDA
jgi:mono/diheme cytochrome c family protein